MKRTALFMIDGWMEPPKGWGDLGRNAVSTGVISVAYGFDRKDPALIQTMEKKILEGYRIAAIGHSFGAAMLAKISLGTPLFAAVFVDAVNEEPMWSRNWLKTWNIEHAVAYRRAYRDFPILRGGPPSVGVLGATNFLIHCGWNSHNRIISHISSEVVFWLNQICREEPPDGRATA